VKKFSLKTLLLRIADVIEMEIPETELRKNDFIVRKKRVFYEKLFDNYVVDYIYNNTTNHVCNSTGAGAADCTERENYPLE